MKNPVNRQLIWTLLVLACFQTQTVPAQQNYLAYNPSDKSVLFSEMFDNNGNDWITDNSWISASVANGFYNVTCKNFNQSTGLSTKPVGINAGSDFEIEASFKILKGTGALVFGMTGSYDHYRIELSDAGSLSIFKDTPSKRKKLETLYSGAGSFKITNDYNKLTARCVKGIFYIFANEVLVGGFTNIKPEGNQVGFNVGTNSGISVDYLKVEMILPQQPVNALTALNQTTVPDIQQSDQPIAEQPATEQPATEQPAAEIISVTAAGPLIQWVSPSTERITLETFSARVRASVSSSTGLKSVLLYVNGVSKGEAEIIPAAEPNTFTVEKNINFGPGENNIYLVATNSTGSTKSDLRYFTNPSAVSPEVLWSLPEAANTLVNRESIIIGACIKSPTELTSVRLLVNGMVQSEDNVFQVSSSGDCNYNWQKSVILKEGDNSIFIIATNVAGSTTSEKRLVKLEPASTERRIALVFGNSQYSHGTPLKNPVNDANLMEGTLRELNFDVIKRINATKEEMMQALREFNERLPEYQVALFYYAGHGNQVDGKNFLIPTDAKLEKPTDCRFEAVDVEFIIEEFEKYQDNTNIVILDACRNNPYTAWARGNSTGFRAMTFSSGTIIAFATQEGATAADGSGANGLYTEELVKQMMVPQSVLSVFMNTRAQVKKLSNNSQIPMEWNQLNGDFYFKR